MKSNHKLALAVLAGILIGVAGARSIHAQQSKTGPGYFIAEVEVTDAATMKKYGEKVPETQAPFNHHYLVRSSKIQTLEGEPPKGGIIMIEFDSPEKAREWYATRPPIPPSSRSGKARPRAASLSSKVSLPSNATTSDATGRFASSAPARVPTPGQFCCDATAGRTGRWRLWPCYRWRRR